MHPKDPVYLLTAAVERVKDTIPDQDAEAWLKDHIAAGSIEWAYVIWKKEQHCSFQLFITIPPSAVIIESPDLKLDRSKGTVTIQRRREAVECPIVVSRRDLDRELANITTPPSSAPVLKAGAAVLTAGAPQPDAGTPETRRDQPPDKQPSSRGRPTLKTEIESAYKALRRVGDINFDAPKTCLYEQIREKVREHKGDPSLEKGLQDEALRKVISPLFEADKTSSPAHRKTHRKFPHKL